MLDAIKSGNKAEIVAAKLALMAALDEYRKTVDGIGEDLSALRQARPNPCPFPVLYAVSHLTAKRFHE